MDLDSYASFFALTPENQAEDECRVEDDAERTAAAQALAEASRVAKDLEQHAKRKATEEFTPAKAARLRKHHHNQRGECVEYQVLRVYHPPWHGWPTNEEV